MGEESSNVNWSELEQPLSSALFDKYTYQSILPPLLSLGIDESAWNQCRSHALDLGRKGFVNPLSILYTSFKQLYPNCPSIRSFSRWLTLYEKDHSEFKPYLKEHSFQSSNFQSAGELVRLTQTVKVNNPIVKMDDHIRQVWFLFSISIRSSNNDNGIIADALIVDDGVSRLSLKQRKHTTSRIHCLFALTPSGKFSNQLIICKQGRGLKINFTSSKFTRILQTSTSDISHEHIQQWFEDFASIYHGEHTSALVIDPRMTLLTSDIKNICHKANFELITTDFNYYLVHVLSPVVSLFDKKCAEINSIEKMYLKPSNDLQRIIHTIWYSLRTLKQNEQICQMFNQTSFWRHEDELYLQKLRSTVAAALPKKKRKKSLVKTGSKGKLSSTMMIDPPSDSTPEQIFSYVIQRQLSISRASKFLGGMKLDYLKYCLSSKTNPSLLTGSRLIELNTFMQSQSTVDWLRHLRSLHYWPCAKQLFLREIYQWTGIITRKRSHNVCTNGNIGAIRSCDLQSPSSFWQAFEDIHQIQFDNEPMADQEQWNNDFQHYLARHKLNNEKTELWTIDTFEFPLMKKSTVLQLPEWNELRPMNLTPKVTVVYAFSSTGQATEPHFIFPNSLRESSNATTTDDKDSYNELGHLTPQLFLSWIETNLNRPDHPPTVLVFCSRLPVLSPSVLSSLESYNIYPYGYPYSRTLPFRYLFERRVRNNRSTNMMSELWKKKLLDEQRTHVLKCSNCTVTNMKYYFDQVWFQIINEQHSDDDHHKNESKTIFDDKCKQAFQQANIEIKYSNRRKNSTKITPQRSSKKVIQAVSNLSNELQESTANNGEIVEQLNHLLNIISQFKEQITSANISQILKIKNHFQSSTDAEISTHLNGVIRHTTNGHSPSTSSESTHLTNSRVASTTNDKRSLDENDEPHIAKRLRSSRTSTNNTTNDNKATPILKWIPPSQKLVRSLQTQSSSLFQFTLSLINTILTSIDYQQLTDEHTRWLHSTLNSYGHDYSSEKIDVLIETACKVAKISFVR